MRNARPRSYAARLLSRDHPFRIAGFRRLAVSYGLNELGDTFALVALAILVFSRTGSALAMTGLFLCSKFVPAIAAPALTARLDRGAPRRVLPALYAVEAAAFAGLAYVATRFSLAAVLVLSLVDGLLAITARGLSRAAVAAVLTPRDALRSGNAVLNVIFSVMGAAGPALAGVVVATTSASAALALDAGSFVAVALLLVTCGDLPAARVELPEPWTQRVRAGMRYVRDNPLLRTLIGAESVGWILFTLVAPIEVVYARESLGTGAAGFGALVAAWGAGMIVGSWLFARWRYASTRTLVGTSTLLAGIGYLGMAGAPELVTACVAAAVGGIGNGVQWISVLTAIQEATEERFQARVVGLIESLTAAAPGVGFLLGGLLTALSSPRLAFVVSGVGIVLVALAMARRIPRE